MPLADAKLLASEEDKSWVFDLSDLGSLGGRGEASGEEGRFEGCDEVAGVVVIVVAVVVEDDGRAVSLSSGFS